MDSSILTLKMLTEFCSDKTNGKKLMSFDDFQYNNINTQILNQYIEKKDAKSEGHEEDFSDESDASKNAKIKDKEKQEYE